MSDISTRLRNLSYQRHSERGIDAIDEILREAADAIDEALRCLEGEPEYHYTGMGCGLEDRGITDRYDAMHHGWECALERVYSENIAWAKSALTTSEKDTTHA